MEKMMNFDPSINIQSSSYPLLTFELRCDQQQFGCVHLNSTTTISNNEKNKWFLNNENEIVAMEYAITKDHETFIFGPSITFKCDFFTEPLH